MQKEIEFLTLKKHKMKKTNVTCNCCKSKFTLINLQANLVGFLYICSKCSLLKQLKK